MNKKSEDFIGKTKPEPQGFTNYNELNRTLRDLDERALVLTLAAFVEDTLGELLLAFMLPNPAAKKIVVGFEAPLGTLSARIKACYALGLLSKGQYHDFEHLRDIRNAFSHTWKPISFADPSIAGHIKSIRFSRIEERYPETPIKKVLSSFQLLLIELQVTIENLPKDKKAKFVGMNLTGKAQGTTFEDRFAKAIPAIEQAETDHGASKGEKKIFFDGLLRLWLDRLTMLAAEAPPERFLEVVEIRDRVESHLKGRPDPDA